MIRLSVIVLNYFLKWSTDCNKGTICNFQPPASNEKGAAVTPSKCLVQTFFWFLFDIFVSIQIHCIKFKL